MTVSSNKSLCYPCVHLFHLLAAPRDYTGGRYEATFVAGSSTAEVAIPIVADGCFDGVGLETFFGDLSISADATAKGVRAGPNTVATVNVVDDDPAPEVNFAPTMYEVLENAGQLTSMLVASEPACEDYDVTVATRDETATCKSHQKDIGCLVQSKRHRD